MNTTTDLSFLLSKVQRLYGHNYNQWRTQLLNVARFLGCHAPLLGTAPPEPGRIVELDTPHGQVAGDSPPMQELDSEGFEAWRSWAREECMARSLIMWTIDETQQKEMEVLWSAACIMEALQKWGEKCRYEYDKEYENEVANMALSFCDSTSISH